ncbi:MAG: GNAT family N-acetyltransferase [Actinomycetota bacterium]|nr:GNAT family N-acetyltransferase [Actinomycetota bacterium]
MPEAISIDRRPATEADENFLYRLYASTRVEELAGTGWDESSKEAFLRMQYDAQTRSHRAGHPQASFDIILIDGRPAGRLCVDRDAEAIHVIDLALLPDHRGRSVGTQLLEELVQEGRTDGRRVTLNVERSNRARSLYERLGFRVIHTGEVYLDLEWSPA